MEELNVLLHNITDTYDDFIEGVLSYAKRKKSRCDRLINFIKSNNNVQTSNVLEFMLNEPDFYEDEAPSPLKNVDKKLMAIH